MVDPDPTAAGAALGPAGALGGAGCSRERERDRVPGTAGNSAGGGTIGGVLPRERDRDRERRGVEMSKC